MLFTYKAHLTEKQIVFAKSLLAFCKDKKQYR
jgi:hypothetical protein